MNQDQELSELYGLCKEVYTRTEWQEDDCNAIRDDGAIFHTSVELVNSEGFTVLYTSDYLLEKLQEEMVEWKLNYNFWKRRWELNKQDARLVADTPREALLKLVIALDDAGVKL